jgi:hypothetical protein
MEDCSFSNESRTHPSELGINLEFRLRDVSGSGQTNGGAKAKRNRREEEERGRVRCAELYGFP